jgi:hypothetical protein
MWKCKHCNKKFGYNTTSEKANHSRWCDKNPSRGNGSHLFVRGIVNKFGELKQFEVTCGWCSKIFSVTEREKLFPKKERYFCTRSCANSVGGTAKAEKHHPDDTASYRAVAWRHHEKKCVVCGEDKVIAVHHFNENHNDNRPENLVPMCPTHHQYMHSKYKGLILETVEKYVSSFVETQGR